MISSAEFRRSVSTQDIKTLKLIYFAIFMGVTAFFGIVIYMFKITILPEAPYDADFDNVYNLTIINIFLTLTMYIVSHIIYNRRLKGLRDTISKKIGPSDNDDDASSIMANFRVTKILQLAMFEGPAFFGLIVCFMAVNTGVLKENPLYWLNSFSYLILIGFIFKDFPTIDKIVKLYNDKIVQNL